jgi:hypothetical protein
MEGGIGFGLGAVTKSQLTIEGGAVQEGNFDGYDVLRLNEMPQIEVHIMPSSERPTGVGEPGVPPIGPAVANAIYAATRKRMRFSRSRGRKAPNAHTGWPMREIGVVGTTSSNANEHNPMNPDRENLRPGMHRSLVPSLGSGTGTTTSNRVG